MVLVRFDRVTSAQRQVDLDKLVTQVATISKTKLGFIIGSIQFSIR